MTEHDIGTPSPRAWSVARIARPRTALALGIFVLLIIAANLRTPALPATVQEGTADAGRLAISSTSWPQTLLSVATDSSGVSAVAVDGFLSRFDAVIRMAEARALAADDAAADSAVEALRSLRRETYVVMRQALKPGTSRTSLPTGNRPEQ